MTLNTAGILLQLSSSEQLEKFLNKYQHAEHEKGENIYVEICSKHIFYL